MIDEEINTLRALGSPPVFRCSFPIPAIASIIFCGTNSARTLGGFNSLKRVDDVCHVDLFVYRGKMTCVAAFEG